MKSQTSYTKNLTPSDEQERKKWLDRWIETPAPQGASMNEEQAHHA
jgi:hypothetical protein